jgi:sporulation protein YlmC with PRC-barrel domain
MSDTSKFANSPVKASNIIGTNVVNTKDENLGDIKEMVIDPQTCKVVYAVMSVGGFLSMGEKLFAIPFSAFTYSPTKNEYILDVDKTRLKDAPGFDSHDWPAMSDEKWNRDIHSYYNRTPYWE